jgi:hypothetical protein
MREENDVILKIAWQFMAVFLDISNISGEVRNFSFMMRKMHYLGDHKKTI